MLCSSRIAPKGLEFYESLNFLCTPYSVTLMVHERLVSFLCIFLLANIKKKSSQNHSRLTFF